MNANEWVCCTDSREWIRCRPTAGGAIVKRSAREKEILHALARKVRYFSLEQVAETWWPETRSPRTYARRGLRRLAEHAFVDEVTLFALPLQPLVEPLFRWYEGRAAPDFGQLAYRMQTRFDATPQPIATRVFAATRATLYEFGGPSTLKEITLKDGTHDLHVAGIYCLFHRTRPADATAWIGEDVRPKAGYRLKDPDAVLEFEDGRRPLVIEFGGRSYQSPHLQDFHADCANRGRDYELW